MNQAGRCLTKHLQHWLLDLEMWIGQHRIKKPPNPRMLILLLKTEIPKLVHRHEAMFKTKGRCWLGVDPKVS